MSVAETTTRPEIAATGAEKRAVRKGPLGTVLRVVVSIGLIVWLLQMTSLDALGAAVAGMSERWPFLALAALSPMLGFLIVAFRWKVLLGGFEAATTLRQLLAALLVGGFFNNFFPSTIGGDIARSWWIQKALKSSTLSLTIVAMDRFIGLVGFCGVGLIAVACQPAVIGNLPQFWIVVAVVGTAIASLAVVVRPGTARRAKRLFELPLLGRFRDKAAQAYQGVVQIHSARPRLFGAVVISMLLQLNIITEYYILSFAVDAPIGFSAFAILIPIVTLVALLPVSINGIGLREGTLAAVGAAFGLGVENAILLSWLFLAFTLPYALVGGIIYATGKRAR